MDSQRFSITITLKPKWYKVLNATEQYDLVSERLLELFSDHIPHNYTFVAELTKASNIHFHGTITYVKMLPAKLVKIVNDNARTHTYFGLCCVKIITEEPGWAEYMRKDFKITTKLINRPSILMDGLSYYPLEVFPIKAEF